MTPSKAKLKKVSQSEKPPKASTNTGSLKNLQFFRTNPPGCQRPAPEYATSGVFCYERTFDDDGHVHYRRALWSRILEAADGNPDGG